MMRHFDMKRYPRKRGEDLYTTYGGGDNSIFIDYPLYGMDIMLQEQ